MSPFDTGQCMGKIANRCSAVSDESASKDFAHPNPSRREGLFGVRLTTLARAIATACYFECWVAAGGEWCCWRSGFRPGGE